MLDKQIKRIRRHRRVTAKIKGTVGVPRLCVFRSSMHIIAQLIDDEKGKTILSASDGGRKSKIKISKSESKTENKEKNERSGKTIIAFEIGKLIAKSAAEKNIKKIVFDRGGYKYHGRVKAVAEGAREGGLQF